MGGGTYNASLRYTRAEASGYYDNTISNSTIFYQTDLGKANQEMLPYNIVRESRDSEEHPESISIIIALDVTGSMSNIPREFIKDGLPTIMKTLQDNNIEHAQVCFVAVGDHEVDAYPLQVGQFESSDELMDKWLQMVYLECGGGGNAGESYGLAWKFAADHVQFDSFTKRNQKGFLFTIGDEPNLRKYPGTSLNSIFGGQNRTEYDSDLFQRASEKWNCYHIFIEHSYRKCDSAWKQLLGDSNLKVVSNYNLIPDFISQTIKNNINSVNSSDEYSAVNTESEILL